ncbi:MAG TPA: hypothetical protein VJN43_23570 [Bryobacteraceae bacterium]|nr:hypothetical protein [Bryobacteraceae bacterium]
MTRHFIAVIVRVAAAAWLAISIPGPANAQPPKPLDKTAIHLFRTEDGHKATLIFHEKTGVLNLGIVPNPATRHALLSMTKRIELWKPLVEELFEKYGRRKDYRLTVGLYPELGGRIAAAAACSGKWNPKTGQSLEGAAGAALKDLFTNHALYRELDAFFDTLGYRVSLDSAEAVMRCRWNRVKPEPVDPTCHPNVRPLSWVPCGASLVFRLDAKE